MPQPWLVVVLVRLLRHQDRRHGNSAAAQPAYQPQPTGQTARYGITGEGPQQQGVIPTTSTGPATASCCAPIPSGGVSGSPAPTGSGVGQGNDPALDAMLPPGWLQQGHTVEEYTQKLSAVAGMRNVAPGYKTLAENKLKAITEYLSKRGEETLGSQLRTAEPTGPMKKAALQG